MAVLESAEVGHCDPDILVHLVRVARRNACLRCKRKLGHRVRPHLLGVARVVRKWRGIGLLSGLLLLRLGLLLLLLLHGVAMDWVVIVSPLLLRQLILLGLAQRLVRIAALGACLLSWLQSCWLLSVLKVLCWL